VYACQVAYIHSLGLLVEGERELQGGDFPLRQIQYHDPQVFMLV
jgi:hypothetical protein